MSELNILSHISSTTSNLVIEELCNSKLFSHFYNSTNFLGIQLNISKMVKLKQTGLRKKYGYKLFEYQLKYTTDIGLAHGKNGLNNVKLIK